MAENQLTVKNLFAKDEVRQKFQEILGKKAQGFITSVLQIVAQNNNLVNADPHTVYHAAATAATMDLPLNNQLGFAYIVPYKTKQPDGSYKDVAQFQMGYKGFIQLSMRSGQFLTMNSTDVRQGEIKKHDRLRDEIEFAWVEDQAQRLKLPIIAYVSYFKLLNGFEKIRLMYVEEIKEHGAKYSKTYNQKFGLWTTDFDGMAHKTVTKL
ncbi:MAG TPA: recombinase RecT, partial [Puia sp.]|nr:recombinase RecT [Puia sp.]